MKEAVILVIRVAPIPGDTAAAAVERGSVVVAAAVASVWAAA